MKNKEANFLMSPAIFDPNHPNREGNQRRGLKNIRYLRHIWFDFENGDLKPEEVAELFPLNQMVIFNTYNHTADAPRFRVIFPTSQRLTSEAYEAVWDNFAAKLRHAGYTVGNKDQQTSKNSRPSGLDVSKRSAASLFYAPCQAKNPADSFFGVTAKLLGNCWTQFFGLQTALYHFEYRSSPKIDLLRRTGGVSAKGRFGRG